MLYKVNIPNWFMTLPLSIDGLGFQLLIIAIMLPRIRRIHHPFHYLPIYFWRWLASEKQYLRLKLLIIKNLYYQFKYITSDLNNFI
jgi:hypothetical protein